MRARFADLFVIILGAFFLLVVMQVLVTEWDAGSPVVWRLRPPWLLPAILAAVAGSMGQFLLRATRLAGAATLTGLLALAVRGGLLVLFDFDLLSADPWLAILPGLIAVDLWSGLQWARTGRPAGALSAGLATLAGTALGGFPLINGLFTYPRIDGGNLLPMLVASLVAALAGTWSGVRLGEAVRTVHRPLTGEGEISLPMRFAPAGGLIAALTFIVIFIITARPPV